MHARPPSRTPLLAAGLAALALAGPAAAQTMATNSASFNAGYGRVPDQENHPVQVGLRDANGNLVVINGVIQTGVSANAFAAGAASSFSGAGASTGAGGSSMAIGNNLSVVTQGDNNIVIVDSRQTNNGTVTATTQATGNGGDGQ